MAFSTIAKGAAANDGTGTPARSGADIINALIDAANNGALQGFKNRLYNGCFRVNQDGFASNADDTYGIDGWIVLTQTGTVAVSTQLDLEAGAPVSLRLTQSQASAQRMGIAQIIESGNCRDLRAAITTLAGRVKLSSTDTLRYAVLEHTGAADSVTSDVVNSWTNTTYTAGQFFIAGLNVLAVGQVSCTATTWRDLTALNATLGASANNIVVFVWTENAVAQNVTLDFNRLQWEPGSVASKFELRPLNMEQALCERYLEHSFSLGTAPAQNIGTATGEELFGAIIAGAITQRWQSVHFRHLKRINPTITLYNPSAANGEIRDITGAVDFTGSGTTNVTRRAFRIFGTANAATAVDNSCGVHWRADSRL